MIRYWLCGAQAVPYGRRNTPMNMFADFVSIGNERIFLPKSRLISTVPFRNKLCHN